MFCPELIKNTVPGSECTGWALAVRMELYNALCQGAIWFASEPPRFTVGVLGEVAAYIQEWLRCHAAPPAALEASLPENNEQKAAPGYTQIAKYRFTLYSSDPFRGDACL